MGSGCGFAVLGSYGDLYFWLILGVENRRSTFARVKGRNGFSHLLQLLISASLL